MRNYRNHVTFKYGLRRITDKVGEKLLKYSHGIVLTYTLTYEKV